MSTYNEMFKLTLKDVDLIERTLCQHISHLSPLERQPNTMHQRRQITIKKLLS